MSLFDIPHDANSPWPTFYSIAADLSSTPIVYALARPGGPVSRILSPLTTYFSSDLQRVAAISGYYTFVVYIVSSGLSINATAIGNPNGYRNHEPRLEKRILKGFAHRLSALHENLLEFFPAFVLCTILTLALPIYGADHQLFERSLNLLALHAFIKSCVYIPMYAAGFATARTFSHMLAIASLLGLFWGILIATE